MTEPDKKAAYAAFLMWFRVNGVSSKPALSALAGLEARVALADHENLAAATDDLAVAMALLGGFERRQYFHGGVYELGI
jgi:hypothetical protein